LGLPLSFSISAIVYPLPKLKPGCYPTAHL